MWNACKINLEDAEQPNHEMDLLSGHENDVNYVQFRYMASTFILSLPFSFPFPCLFLVLFLRLTLITVLYSGCATVSRSTMADTSKEDNLPKFKNSWLAANILNISLPFYVPRKFYLNVNVSGLPFDLSQK